MRRRTVLAALGGAALSGLSGTVFACSCPPRKASLEERVREAYSTVPLIATARPLSSEMVVPEWAQSPEYDNVGEQRVTWEVMEVFKGEPGDDLTTQQIATSYSSCAFFFEVDMDYLLYLHPAHNGEPHYLPGLCDGLQFLAFVEPEELMLLRQLREASRST